MKKSNSIKKAGKEFQLLGVFRRSEVQVSLFILAISVLSIFTFQKVLEFGFWRDDWSFLWAAQNHPDLPLAWNLHPATKYEDIILFKFFGWNSVLWQWFGIFLRILASLSLALMLWGLTSSKKIAALAGIFFSVSFIGLETVSWRSVHVVPVIIIFTCVGFYFFSQYLHRKSKKYFFAVLLFFILATLSDPPRAIPVILLSGFLYIINWWRSEKKQRRPLRQIIIEMGILVAPLAFIMYQFSQSTQRNNTLFFIKQDITAFEKTINIVISIGNATFGWIKHIPELAALSSYDIQNAILGSIFLIGGGVISIFFIYKKKNEIALLSLFFLCWIMLFYLPNWVFDKNLILAGTHRYIGLAGVGIIGIMALLIGSLKSFRLIVIISMVVVLLNTQTSQRILANEMKIRSKAISDNLWNKVDSDVTKNEKDSIFMYLGGDITRGYIMDWSGSVPFGVRRGVTQEDDFPIVTTDYALIVNLLCKKDVSRPAVTKWSIQKTIIPLSHVHAWEVTEGKIENVSLRERKILEEKAVSQGCTVKN